MRKKFGRFQRGQCDFGVCFLFCCLFLTKLYEMFSESEGSSFGTTRNKGREIEKHTHTRAQNLLPKIG